MSKNAIITFVYPGTEKYINDLLFSIINQSCQDFDLLIINDNLNEIYGLIEPFNEIKTHVFHASGSIPKIREYGIRKSIELGYEVLVFIDADDIMAHNRVEVLLEKLKKEDIVINDISTITSKGESIIDNYYSKRLINEQKIYLKHIFNKNIFGLSNTAIKANLFINLKIPEDIIAVDWFIFSKVLLNGKRAIFTNETLTLYRQHSNNIIGLSQSNLNKMQTILDVKYKHYFNLRYENDVYMQLFESLKLLKDKLIEDNNLYNNYDTDQITNKYPFWWEQLKI